MSANNIKQRREFLKTSIKGGVILGIGMSSIGSALSSCAQTNKATSISGMKTGFDQKPLPYAFNALENVIDAATMEIHYTKHAATYAKNLKEAVTAENVGASSSLEDILGNISKYSSKMRNNGGGHYNHEMFWQCMRSKKDNNRPAGKLLTEIEKNFTSFEKFKTEFSDAAKNRFGSGWAWLYMDEKKALHVGSTPNQDNPLMNISEVKGLPLLALDVWEHAYYLKYQNKRPDYIENWWNLVNWEYVEKRMVA